MQNDLSKYYSLIDNETRWMCRIVQQDATKNFNHEFHELTRIKFLDKVVFEKEVNAARLLEKLKRHRLYPIFYKKWKEWEDRPQGNNWQQFELSLKKLVERNQIRMIQKASELIKIVNTFKKNGIRVISLKGPVLAQQLYGNIALKASIDLDILIDEKDFDKAWNCLYTLEYNCPGMEKGFSPKQKSYLIKNFHHIDFSRKDENLHLELHWMLNTNRYFLEYPFEMLYSNALEESIGGSEIKVLSPLHQSIHLMAHGAYHQWARLDWLLEWSTLMEQYSEKIRFEEEVKRNGLERIAKQTLFLKKLFFQDEQVSEVKSEGEYKIIKYALCSIQKNYITSNIQDLGKFQRKLKLTYLKKDIRFKIRVITALSTNRKDWELFPLPDSLFFLYIFLRPFFYLIYLIKKKNT
jgi:hypothetical protein